MTHGGGSRGLKRDYFFYVFSSRAKFCHANNNYVPPDRQLKRTVALWTHRTLFHIA